MPTRDILIVEDVDTMRSLLSAMIGQIPGFRVSGTARNGWDARIELTRRRPDLVLLDEILPGESSLDLLREIRAQGLPVILLTGIESPGHPVPPEAQGRLVKPAWTRAGGHSPADQRRFQEAFERVFGA